MIINVLTGFCCSQVVENITTYAQNYIWISSEFHVTLVCRHVFIIFLISILPIKCKHTEPLLLHCYLKTANVFDCDSDNFLLHWKLSYVVVIKKTFDLHEYYY